MFPQSGVGDPLWRLRSVSPLFFAQECKHSAKMGQKANGDSALIVRAL